MIHKAGLFHLTILEDFKIISNKGWSHSIRKTILKKKILRSDAK